MGSGSSRVQVIQQPPQSYPQPVTVDWSYDRDRIYTLVLSADEFLGTMHETDARISLLSTTSDREIHLTTIQELLGLRGHMQDELLRIERMLAADDPELKCLDFLTDNFPHVVGKLRELREKGKLVMAKEIQDALPPSLAQKDGSDESTDDVPLAGFTNGLAPDQHNFESFSRKAANKRIMGKNSSFGTISGDMSAFTEEELKDKHKQEEKQVAKNYAEQIVTKNEVTQSDIDRLLQDHALNMQALRNRQDRERSINQEKINAKLKDRLRNKPVQQHEDQE